MKLCPVCLRCYEDAETSCLADQSTLVAARPGTRMIADKYRLDQLLGRGGMGAVYEGTHVDLDRKIAIKLLLPDFIADSDALERFRREARAAARLNHPNVADTYDYGLLPEGGAYIVMEMVEGQTLREYMDAAGPLSITEAANIGRQVAEGVEAAHHRDIIHRDLKPSNIILTRNHQGNLQAKVVDFGVAQLKEYSTTGGGLTTTGSLIGTPRYMSPEQCSGHKTDARSDIYSMGVILYEMLAGHPPFDAPTATAIAIKHIQEQPPSLKESRADIPEKLETFVEQTLDKDPDKRPQTAAEFGERLKEAVSAAAETIDETTIVRPRGGTEVKGTREGLGTDAFHPASKITQRAGAPTAEHSSERVESSTDPSVQAYVVPPVETTTELATKIAEPAVQSNQGATQTKSATAEVSNAAMPATVELRKDDVTLDGVQRDKRRPMLVYAAATLGLAMVVAAIWFALSRSSSRESTNNSSKPERETVNQTAPSPVKNSATPGSTNETNSNDASTQKAAPRDARTELSAALEAWIAATNARDVNQQMTFYAPTLNVFYQKRNVTQSAVRAEKSRLFSQISSIDVRAGAPEILFSDDGRTATMRFHKSWTFTGAQSNSGEVVQELEWRKTESGWKIAGERDVQVIR